MKLIDALRRVRGAVASSATLQQSFLNFAFANGRVHATDGRIYISSPLPKANAKLSGAVDARKLIAALEGPSMTDEEPKVLIKEGVLHVIGERLQARIQVSTDVFPLLDVLPITSKSWSRLKDESFVGRIERVRPFVGDDASRAWACGVLLDGEFAYATNNVSIVRTPIQPLLKKGALNVPLFAVDALLGALETPELYAHEPGLSFMYANGTFLRTSLFDHVWPKPPESMFKLPKAQYVKVPAGLLEAVQSCAPLCADQLYPTVTLDSGFITTPEGTSVATVTGFTDPRMRGRYRVEPLIATLEKATHVAWSQFPRVPWRGDDGLEGILLGIPT